MAQCSYEKVTSPYSYPHRLPCRNDATINGRCHLHTPEALAQREENKKYKLDKAVQCAFTGLDPNRRTSGYFNFGRRAGESRCQQMTKNPNGYCTHHQDRAWSIAVQTQSIKKASTEEPTISTPDVVVTITARFRADQWNDKQNDLQQEIKELISNMRAYAIQNSVTAQAVVPPPPAKPIIQKL